MLSSTLAILDDPDRVVLLNQWSAETPEVLLTFTVVVVVPDAVVPDLMALPGAVLSEDML